MSLDSSRSILHRERFYPLLTVETAEAGAPPPLQVLKAFLVVAAKVSLVVLATLAVYVCGWALFRLGLPFCAAGFRAGSALLTGGVTLFLTAPLPPIWAVFETGIFRQTDLEGCGQYLKRVACISGLICGIGAAVGLAVS